MTTPARRQYLDIKAQYADALLAYQVGDFFEFFDDDARIASAELQIVLTARSYGQGQPVPLAGVPLHALDTYLTRLVARGHKVAICEQVSPPGRGLVQRAVTRMLTPGTLTDSGMLPARSDNYLVAVSFGGRDTTTGLPVSAGLAYIDASTGAFGCAQWAKADLPDALRNELERLRPAEVLVASASAGEPAAPLPEELPWLAGLLLTPCPAHHFDPERASERLRRHFATTTLVAFGCAHLPLACAAAGAILSYVERMNAALLPLLTDLRTYDTTGYVALDGRTLRALEVTEPATLRGAQQGSGRQATLLGVLDATRTAPGARLLRRMLLQPLKDRATIEERLDAVSELFRQPAHRDALASALAGAADLERLTARIVQGTATPRDLYGVAGALARIPELRAALRDCHATLLATSQRALDPCVDLRERIEQAIVAPAEAEGRVVREGYDQQLDALRGSIRGSRQWIASLEASERERTGIKSLKVGYNGVFGYYIEVTRPNLQRVPANYVRRQTTATGERFVTTELREHEALVLHAEQQIADRERAVFLAYLGELGLQQARLRAAAAACAQIDVLLALAEVAVARNYVRPAISESAALEIVGGRHAIVEAVSDGGEFTANDTALGDSASDNAAYVLLLTGPNMAGKSTYLRQVATIVLLAQIGSFVPATRATIGLVDRICTRVGAEDNLAHGLSTFMVEMVETAYILRHASARSLLIFDEIGRGTSTTDGLAIARAVIEYVHTHVGARTLFATHFQELARLAEELPRLCVCQMAVEERDGEAIFLHRVAPGASASSYGVQVARMAGLPLDVTTRAAALLAQPTTPPTALLAERLADYLRRSIESSSNATAALAPLQSAPLDGETAREVILALASVNIAATTPVEALNLLFSLQQRALQGLRVGGAETR